CGRAPLDAHASGARTDPDEARGFVADTGVDALAVAVGSVHAMTTRTATLDHGLLGRLAAAVPVPLVLHGSSGVPDDELVRAVAGGIAKVNIGTALNAAMTGAIRDVLAARPEAVDSRTYLGVGREAMAREVTRIVRVLGRPDP
ncbi:class II fructose-bisphosphate aldolase, partial [Streptomyces sp. NPDC004752]